MRRLILAVIISVLGLSWGAGCGKRYRLKRDQLGVSSAWPYLRGDRQGTGFFPDGRFKGRIDILWEAKNNSKLVAPMSLYHGHLVYPATRKRIVFYDTHSGRKLGRIKSRGRAQSGLVVKDSVAFFALGAKKNRLVAWDLLHKKTVWRRPIKDVVPGSIVVDNRLLVSTGNGLMAAFDPATGEEFWSLQTDGRLVVGPAYADGRLFQPDDGGRIYVVAVDDGHLIRRLDLGKPVLNAVAVSGLVFAVTMDGDVIAAMPDDSSIVWRSRVTGPVWTAPAVAGQRLVIAGSNGDVVALDRTNGEAVWSFSAGEVVRASPVVVGQFVAVGTMTGKVYVLSLNDGRPSGMAELKGGIEYPPVTDGHCLFVATNDGRIACLGDKNEQTDTTTD